MKTVIIFLNLFIRCIAYLRHIPVLHGCVSSLGIGEGGHATTPVASVTELSQALVLFCVPPSHVLEHAPHALQALHRLVSEYEIRSCLLKYINLTFTTILNFVVMALFAARLIIVITR